MILYHISKNLLETNLFEPRVPFNATSGEAKIPRICLSSSIEGCLSAINYGGEFLDMYNSRGDSLYKVYRIDTEKYRIPDENIVTPLNVYQSGVYDATITQEYWILQAIEVAIEDTFIMKLNDWKEQVTIAVPYEIAELKQKGMGRCNIIKLWQDFTEDNDKYGTDEYPPYVTKIFGIKKNEYSIASCEAFLSKPDVLFEMIKNEEITSINE